VALWMELQGMGKGGKWSENRLQKVCT